MNVQGGQLTQSPLNPVFPASQFTGPLTAGNIKDWDGSSTLAGLGSTAGALANVGYAKMVQAGRITQAASPGSPAGVFVSPDIIIPAQSLILAITTLILSPWTGAATTFGIGNTVSPTTYTAAGAVTGAANATTSVTTETGATLLNWVNIGNVDEQMVFTST